MFHKEGSCVEIISPSSSSSNSSGGGGNNNNNNKGKGTKKGKQQQQQQSSRKKKDLNETITTKVVDIPLRKSDRRKLRQRAAAYFLRNNVVDDSIKKEVKEEDEEIVGSSNNNDQEENKTKIVTPLSSQPQQPQHQQFEQLLDDIFIKGGTVSSRSMPITKTKKITTTNLSNTKGNHESMILYVKSPPSSSNNTEDQDDSTSSSSSLWPYTRKHQFIWMAIEDKKSNTVLKETPTVAVLAVLFHRNRNPSPAVLSPSPYYSNRIVTIPSPASKYLCRGADLMRAGIISAPQPTTVVAVAAAATASSISTQTAASKKSNKNKNKKKNKNDDSIIIHDGGNEMVVICVKGNPQPFAVGRSVLHEKTMTTTTTTMTMTEDTHQPAYGYGTKGVGIEIWNCYGDDLWRTTACGSSSTTPPPSLSTTNVSSPAVVNIDDGRYGNPGFMESTATNSNGELYVLPIISQEDDDYDDDDDENVEDIGNNSDDEDDDDNNNDDKEKEKKRTTADDTTEQLEQTGKDGDTADNEEEQGIEEKEEENDDDDDEEQEDSLPSPPSKTPDELFHDVVCQALVNLTKNELPMLVGTFYTKLVRPATMNIVDIKTTTYKKFGNYVKKWQQHFVVDDINGGTTNDDNYYYGLVQTGPDPSNTNNKDPNAMLLSFNRRHDDLHGLKKMKNQQLPGSESATMNSKIVLVSLYTIPTHWTDLLRLSIDDVKATNASSEVRKGTGMLTLPEIRKILDDYIQREELVVPKSSTVVLDGPLTDALYKKKKKNNKAQQQHPDDGIVSSSSIATNNNNSNNTTAYPEKVSRKELSKQFLSKLGQAYALVQMPGSTIIKLCGGSPPKIEIEVIRRQTKKYKTYVRGLEEYNIISAIDEESKTNFCKDITKRLAVSGSIDTDPHSNGRAALAKKGYVEYVFGANIVDELEALFTGDESLSDHGGVKKVKGWDYPRIPLSVIAVTLRKGVPVRKQAKQRRKQ